MKTYLFYCSGESPKLTFCLTEHFDHVRWVAVKADFIFKNPNGLLLRDLENHEIFVRFYQSNVPMLRGNESLKISHVNISKPRSDIQEK